MHTIVLLGAGKIGRMVAHFLGTCGDYRLRVADSHLPAAEEIGRRLPEAEVAAVDFGAAGELDAVLKGADAVISCAPFHCNPLIAERAKAAGVHYLDLTEDVAVTAQVQKLAVGADTAFLPQCGLAPGFITIVSMNLLRKLRSCRDLRLRVGALPRNPANRLAYNLTWSTDGLINEYLMPCEVLMSGEPRKVQPMENLEELRVNGVHYEAFNTSGGLGTLAESLRDEVQNLNYKTIRYPGHNFLMKFLLDDLHMSDHREELTRILERSIPFTYMDQVVIFVSATGTRHDRFTELTYANTVYHQVIDGRNWSAIQITTAAGICAVLDLLMEGKLPQKGFVRQEQVQWEDFLDNRFGQYYAVPESRAG